MDGCSKWLVWDKAPMAAARRAVGVLGMLGLDGLEFAGDAVGACAVGDVAAYVSPGDDAVFV